MRPLRSHPTDEELIARLDGELPLPERVAIERHLAACPRCADLSGRIEGALAVLAAELAAQPPGESDDAKWRVKPAVGVGVGVLAGSLGALLLAGYFSRGQLRRLGLPLRGAA